MLYALSILFYFVPKLLRQLLLKNVEAKNSKNRMRSELESNKLLFVMRESFSKGRSVQRGIYLLDTFNRKINESK